MATERVQQFWRDEQGAGTVFGLLWFALLVGICGLAVDITNGFRSRTMLQATADAAALAAAIDLPDADEAVNTAIVYSTDNMGTEVNGLVLKSDDVRIGKWDHSAKSLDTGSLAPDAVMVRVFQSDENSNPLPVNFLRIMGLQSWNVTAQAVAQRFIPEGLKDGLIARGTVNISSNNSFVNEICVHGQKGVDMESNNYFQTGVNVSMPNLDMLDAQNHNNGLPDALREDILDPRMVNHVEDIMNSFLDPASSPYLPDYITDPSLPAINLAAANFQWSKVQRNRVHYLECKNAQQNLRIPNGYVLTEVVIVADCKIQIGSGSTVTNAVLASRAESTLNGQGNQDKLRQGASIVVESNVQLGLADNCAPGGGVQLFSNNAMQFSSTTTFDGVQIVSGGDVMLGARDQAVRGISVQSGRNIYMTSNNMMGLCSGGAPNLFTVPYYRLVL